MSNVLISPSIIAGDLSKMGEIVQSFDSNIVDFIHMDVMDGHFVPNLTYGPPYMEHLKQHSSIPMDVHLMIEKPELSIDSYFPLKPWSLTIHYESTRFPARLLTLIREAGIVAGLSINPATPLEAIKDILPYADMVLIMSVDPGFYGQSFMESALGRIEKLANFREELYLEKLLIQVDGGITSQNIKAVVDAGADVVVAGSAAFKGGDVNGRVADLKKSAISEII